MSDEIKNEPIDPEPVKELSSDELGQVSGGVLRGLNDPFLDALQTAAASLASAPLKTNSHK
jgi:hypothetical protein